MFAGGARRKVSVEGVRGKSAQSVRKSVHGKCAESVCGRRPRKVRAQVCARKCAQKCAEKCAQKCAQKCAPALSRGAGKKQPLEKLTELLKQATAVFHTVAMLCPLALIKHFLLSGSQAGSAALAGDRRFEHPREYVDGAAVWDLDKGETEGAACVCRGVNSGRSPLLGED